MKLTGSMIKTGAVVLFAAMLHCAASNVSATVVILTNANSTAAFDTQSKAGMFNWTVDGVSALQKQWFWYRVGPAGGEQSIDTLTQNLVVPTDTDADGLNDTLAVQYLNTSATPFTLTASFSLTGGQPGDHNSAVGEVIRIQNTGSTPLDLHLFQYGDFNLDSANPNNDSVAFVAVNEVQQTDPNSASLDVGVVPLPTHHQADLVASGTDVLSSLSSGNPTTLNDANGTFVGNAAWAYQYDQTIPAGGTFLLSVNKKLVVARPPGASQICVHKFYDANVNGLDDDGQVVAGWRFDLNGTDNAGNNVYKSGYTDASGNLCFTNLPPGHYTVAEAFPKRKNRDGDDDDNHWGNDNRHDSGDQDHQNEGDSWMATTATCVSTNLGLGQTVSYKFGNACLGGNGCLNKDGWSHPNTHKLLCSNDFVWLNGLCLRDDNGSRHNFGSNLDTCRSNLRSWLTGAMTGNMANMLSAHLVTMTLNVRSGYVTNNATALIYAPGLGNTGINNNFITIDSLMSTANTALNTKGSTRYGDPDRSRHECLKKGLEDACENRNFVQPTPCWFKTPY